MPNVSPKVIWPVVVYLLLTSVQSNITAITPDMLGFLGPWRGFVLGVVSAVIAGAVGWFVRDPLRADAPAPVKAPPVTVPVMVTTATASSLPSPATATPTPTSPATASSPVTPVAPPTP